MAVSEARKRANKKWQKENTSIVAVHVRNELKEEFKAVCLEQGTTMNAVLLEALHAFLNKAKAGADLAPVTPPEGWEQSKPSVLRTFRSGKWQLDIDQQSDTYGAWLSHADYGVKDYMFGVMKDAHTLDEACSLALANFEEYKGLYEQDHMDE